MARIIQDAEKREVCKNCQRTVGYFVKDVFTDYTRDWQGVLICRQCIYCPGCGKKIAVCY